MIAYLILELLYSCITEARDSQTFFIVYFKNFSGFGQRPAATFLTYYQNMWSNPPIYVFRGFQGFLDHFGNHWLKELKIQNNYKPW